MKNTTLIAAALVLVFGLTMGLTVALTDQATAAPACAQCFYEDGIQCTTILESSCWPEMPYGYLEFGSCKPGGSYNPYCTKVRGCCTADCFCIRIHDPLP
jgi:hypothetical protein